MSNHFGYLDEPFHNCLLCQRLSAESLMQKSCSIEEYVEGFTCVSCPEENNVLDQRIISIDDDLAQ